MPVRRLTRLCGYGRWREARACTRWPNTRSPCTVSPSHQTANISRQDPSTNVFIYGVSVWVESSNLLYCYISSMLCLTFWKHIRASTKVTIDAYGFWIPRVCKRRWWCVSPMAIRGRENNRLFWPKHCTIPNGCYKKVCILKIN